jgi:hypothetical protein
MSMNEYRVVSYIYIYISIGPLEMSRFPIAPFADPWMAQVFQSSKLDEKQQDHIAVKGNGKEKEEQAAAMDEEARTKRKHVESTAEELAASMENHDVKKSKVESTIETAYR